LHLGFYVLSYIDRYIATCYEIFCALLFGIISNLVLIRQIHLHVVSVSMCTVSSCCGQLDEHIQCSRDDQSLRGINCRWKTSACSQIVISVILLICWISWKFWNYLQHL